MSTRCRTLPGLAAVLLGAASSVAAKDAAPCGPPAPETGRSAPQATRANATAPLPARLRDRGEGVPTSMFGTYIRRGEWIVYPFFEYYWDNDYEYKPAELGYAGDTDFRGRFRASVGLLFLGYGLTENLAFELEAAVISATLEKSPDDFSAVPPR